MSKIVFDDLSKKVIGCAIEVHKVLGPGLLESAYEQCLARELDLFRINYKLQAPLPVEYKGVKLDCGYRIDENSHPFASFVSSATGGSGW